MPVRAEIIVMIVFLCYSIVMQTTPQPETAAYKADVERLYDLAMGLLDDRATDEAPVIATTEIHSMKHIVTPSGVTIRFMENTSVDNPAFFLQTLEPVTAIDNAAQRQGVVVWLHDKPDSATTTTRKIFANGEWVEGNTVLMDQKRTIVNRLASLLLQDTLELAETPAQAT